ncbi:unnamed protein product [Ectocarpus sp. CCAP 1310/34]|nr:unnamed protein product [Ectocarpus sp. CCAP 1310/34]
MTDPLGLNRRHPSAHYLGDIWHKWFYEMPMVKTWVTTDALGHVNYLQRRAQLVDGRLLAGDASFKYAKVIRLPTGPDGTRARPVYGIFTIMNEYDQVVFSKAMKTASVHDLKSDLKMMFVQRFVGHGFKLPVILFTVDLAVAELAKGCQDQGDVLGLDCEWEPALGGATPNPVSTLQLSLPDGTAYCFHLHRRTNRATATSTIPKVLQSLLENVPSQRYVGVNVNSDASLLERYYGVKVANMIDVRTHARECWVETSSRSLAGMASSLVGKALPKDPTIRLSRWSNPSLTDEQVHIACLDAYASVLVHLEVERRKDPIRNPAPTTLPAGTKVDYTATTGKACS